MRRLRHLPSPRMLRSLSGPAPPSSPIVLSRCSSSATSRVSSLLLRCPRELAVLLLSLLSLLSLSPLTGAATPALFVAFQAVAVTAGNSSGLAPSARCDSLLLPSSASTSFHLFGGLTASGAANDIWTFSPTAASPFSPSGVWSQPISHTAPFSPRYALAGALLPSTASVGADDSFYLYGGVGEDGSYLDDVWEVEFNSGGDSAGWASVRGLSSQGTAAASPLQSPQPSARAWTAFTGVHFSPGLLAALNATQLATANLQLFLAQSPQPSSPVVAFALYGGRSDPSSPFAVTLTASGVAASSGSVMDSSALNRDYSDLWLYLPSSDVWLLLGNLTCVNRSTVCTDYLTLDALVQNVTASSPLSSFLSNLTTLMAQPARPQSLDSVAGAMTGVAQSINGSLDATLSYLLSHPRAQRRPARRVFAAVQSAAGAQSAAGDAVQRLRHRRPRAAVSVLLPHHHRAGGGGGPGPSQHVGGGGHRLLRHRRGLRRLPIRRLRLRRPTPGLHSVLPRGLRPVVVLLSDAVRAGHGHRRLGVVVGQPSVAVVRLQPVPPVAVAEGLGVHGLGQRPLAAVAVRRRGGGSGPLAVSERPEHLRHTGATVAALHGGGRVAHRRPLSLAVLLPRAACQPSLHLRRLRLSGHVQRGVQ